MNSTKRYIVTGAAGFIGSNFVRELKKRGHRDMIAVDRLNTGEKWKNLMRSGISDYYDKEDFLQLIRNRPNFFGDNTSLIHMGACSSTFEKDGLYMLNNNFAFTKTLAAWALSQDIRTVYASSAATYGDGLEGYSDETDITKLKPLNIYGYSKQLQDLWAQQNGLLNQLTSVKFFNVYGPGEEFKNEMSSVSFKSYEQIKAAGKVKLFKSYKSDIPDGEQKRDFVYVKDAVNMVLFLLDNKCCGIYNIGSGCAESFLSLTGAMFDALRLPLNIEFIDMPAGLAEKYQYFTQATVSKLAQVGYNTPNHTLREAAEDYVHYLNSPDTYTY